MIFSYEQTPNKILQALIMFILFFHWDSAVWLYCPGTYFPSFASLRWFWNQMSTCGLNKNVNNRSSSRALVKNCRELSSFFTFVKRWPGATWGSITNNRHSHRALRACQWRVQCSRVITHSSKWKARRVHSFSMMLSTVLLHLLVTLSFSFSPTYCAPHTSITAIQKQLNFLGYSAISSQNNFESSFKCEACQATLKFQNSFQAIWLLKRHTREKTHQIKAGWILDEENIVKMSRPKGEN